MKNSRNKKGKEKQMKNERMDGRKKERKTKEGKMEKHRKKKRTREGGMEESRNEESKPSMEFEKLITD